MISVAQETAIADLLARGVAQRRIAIEVGVSRSTVGAIATGKRPVHLRPPAEEPEEPRQTRPVPHLRPIRSSCPVWRVRRGRGRV